MIPPASPSSRSDDLNEQSIADVRWRLESAMEKLDDGLLLTALDLIHEAGQVVEAMDERWKRERREASLQYNGILGHGSGGWVER